MKVRDGHFLVCRILRVGLELEDCGELLSPNCTLKYVTNTAKNLHWYHKRYDAIQAFVSKIKVGRVYEIIQIDKTRRINEDLRRLSVGL